MLKHTPLHGQHVALDAKLMNVAGWEMPLEYSSQIAEHLAVRKSAGMFDISHLRPVDIHGRGARDFLRRILATDVARIDDVGAALYACMLNTHGGVVDDMIVYHLAHDWYRLVPNALTSEKDQAWIQSQAREFDVEVVEREDLAMIALQGPDACTHLPGVLDDDLADAATALTRFTVTASDDIVIGRTGFTGEDGFELMLPADQAVATWKALLDKGVTPAGFGARNTLRLEAGLNRYDHDMSEDTTPAECNIQALVDLDDEDRHFVGREAILMQAEQGVSQRLIGLVLDGDGVMRDKAAVREPTENDGKIEVSASDAQGRVTTGGYSPSLSVSVALARVPAAWAEQARLEVRIHDAWHSARVVQPPFVRLGESCIDG